MTAPNPKPATPVGRPSEVERRVMCARYGECLDWAIFKDWENFTCVHCQAFEFETEPGDTDWWNEQGERSRLLLYWAGILPKALAETIERKTELQGYSWATDE